MNKCLSQPGVGGLLWRQVRLRLARQSAAYCWACMERPAALFCGLLQNKPV